MLPLARLRYVAFSHFEADECGSLNEWLAVAPRPCRCAAGSPPWCRSNDLANRPARALADGEGFASAPAVRGSTRRTCRTAGSAVPVGDPHPHVPVRRSLHPGRRGRDAVTETDILGPSEAFRRRWTITRIRQAHGRDARAARARPADDARLHARQRVARRRCRAAARPGSTGSLSGRRRLCEHVS